jgi:hypothetical protein
MLLLSVFFVSCKKSDQNHEINPALQSYSEPESYSATVVRTVEEGDKLEETITHVARLGEMYKEEWTEKGERRAVIFRPDLGKSFLLSIDKKIYTESAVNADTPNAEAKAETSKSAAEIDRAFEAPASPVEAETRTLPDQTIDGYTCHVTEHRARFADGSVEATRHFRAADLAGLALRVEQESQSSNRRTRVVTERRDVRTQVSRDAFEIPSDFRKVDAVRSNQ